MAQAVSPRPLTAEVWVRVRVEFLVEKVALGQIFLRVLLLSLVSIIPPWLSMLIYHLRDEQ
jgi:hypothetical protein